MRRANEQIASLAQGKKNSLASCLTHLEKVLEKEMQNTE